MTIRISQFRFWYTQFWDKIINDWYYYKNPDKWYYKKIS